MSQPEETTLDSGNGDSPSKAGREDMKAIMDSIGARDVTEQYLGKALIAPGFLREHLEKERLQAEQAPPTP